MEHVDRLVDTFATAVNASFREPRPAEWVPEAVRGFELDGCFEWRLQPIAEAPWIAALEARLDTVLPPFYRSLVTRYQFPAFDLGMVLLYANTEQGTRFELRSEIFADQTLSGVLAANHLIHFGRRVDLHPDPICFDGRAPSAEGEYPIVRVDRAATLIARAPVTTRLATGFHDIVGPLLG